MRSADIFPGCYDIARCLVCSSDEQDTCLECIAGYYVHAGVCTGIKN